VSSTECERRRLPFDSDVETGQRSVRRGWPTGADDDGCISVIASWFIDVTIKFGGAGMVLSNATTITFFCLATLLVTSCANASRRSGFHPLTSPCNSGENGTFTIGVD
jgi:hypothetical protein